MAPTQKPLTALPADAECVADGCPSRGLRGEERKLDPDSGHPAGVFVMTNGRVMHYSCYWRRVWEVLHDAGLQ
ncbi:MAG: hypothetical protein LC798_13180 [Chloroflexi bacterium]|nr:hypothetical protein [Chloroflexota bacterium]